MSVNLKMKNFRYNRSFSVIGNYLYILPFMFFFIVFFAFPVFQGLYISFTEWRVAGQPIYVGLKNYIELFHDRLFYTTLKNTLIYVLEFFPLSVIIPLLLAVAINRYIIGLDFFKFALVAPMVVSVSAVGLIWKWMFNTTFGLINYYLEKVGIHGPNWFMDPKFAMLAIVLTSLWWGIGWNLIIFSAGIKNIPQELYEAAQIDGANRWACFWYITLPNLTQTLLFITVTGLIGSFRVFGQVYVLTNGGPYDSTRTLVFYIYDNGFRYFKMGYASSISWILFIIILGITLLQFKYLKGWGEQQ